MKKENSYLSTRERLLVYSIIGIGIVATLYVIGLMFSYISLC